MRLLPLSALLLVLPLLVAAEVPSEESASGNPEVKKTVAQLVAEGKTRAEIMGYAHLPYVSVHVCVYEVKGAQLEGLEPFDLEGLRARLKETREKREPSVFIDMVRGIQVSRPPSDDGARRIMAAQLAVVAGRTAGMSTMQELQSDSQGVVRDPEAHTGDETLQTFRTGTEMTVRMQQDMPTGKLWIDVHAEVSRFEGYVEIQQAQAERGTAPILIPDITIIRCDGLKAVEPDDEEEVFVWQEDYKPNGKSVIVATVSTKLLDAPWKKRR